MDGLESFTVQAIEQRIIIPVRNEQRCCSAADFKKRYKRAAKGLAAAVAKNGCFALQGKPFDSDKQRCYSGAENSRITICAAKNVVPGNVLPLVSTKKKKCRLQ